MPRDVVVKVYKFDELSDEAKEKAREWARRLLDESFDAQELTELFHEVCRERFGLCSSRQQELDVQWSLGYCQGDGVAVYGWLDLQVLCANHPTIKKITAELALAAAEVEVDVEVEGANSYYHHYNSMTVRVYTHYDYPPEEGQQSLFYSRDQIDTQIGALENELEAAIQEVLVDASHELERIGYDEIEYRRSDEVVDDFLRANEYEFKEDGRRH